MTGEVLINDFSWDPRTTPKIEEVKNDEPEEEKEEDISIEKDLT